jgi:rhodanese-related sulfurtransferase
VRALDALSAAAGIGTYVLLDVRDEREFLDGHLEGSGHLPATELTERRAELPPRDAEILVVAGDGTRAHDAAHALEGFGYRDVAWLDAAVSECPSERLVRTPATALWRPSPFLEEVLPLLPDPRDAGRRVLDLAAGAGRESVFMALHGYEVEAWDHDRGALEKAAAMARRHGVTLATQVRDLETRDPRLPVEQHDVVMVFRFLHRPLFPQIARAVAPGGMVVYETYLRGQERFGRPKHPRFLLDHGELPRLFPGFVVERHEERLPQEGPMLARLLARKPGVSSAGTMAP